MNEFILLVLQALYLYLPALIANMVPVLVKNIPLFDCPVDFGKRFRGKRIFGSHKTMRGVFFSVIIAMAIAFLQKAVYEFNFVKTISVIDYSSFNVLLLGFLLGLGAMCGDMIKSFFKRQFNIMPGKPWIPFDQIDFILGATLFMLIVYAVPLKIFFTMFVAGIILHMLFNRIGYWLKIQKDKW